MSQPDRPQIYLVTPPQISLAEFPPQLAELLDNVAVACLRLRLSSTDEETVLRAADAVRAVAHERDVPLVIDSHIALVERLGLDGVHLTDGPKSTRAARKELGPDAIVGAFCSGSRHDGISAGEAGADYVSFGPVGESALGSGERADPELFEWWSEFIELPIVAEGALNDTIVEKLAATTDFFALGDEIWSSENALDTMRNFDRIMSR